MRVHANDFVSFQHTTIVAWASTLGETVFGNFIFFLLRSKKIPFCKNWKTLNGNRDIDVYPSRGYLSLSVRGIHLHNLNIDIYVSLPCAVRVLDYF